jgi:chromate transporter
MTWEQVLVVFLRAAFLSVNGSTTLALLKEDLVDRLRVLTPADFATGVAVGAATPGPLGYGCIALGYLADGWRGALVATFTSWLPTFLVLPLHAFYRRLEGKPWIGGAHWGVGAAGTGLLVALVLSLAAGSMAGWREALFGVVAFVLMFRGAPAPLVLALAAGAGALWLR